MSSHLRITGPHQRNRRAAWEDTAPAGVTLVSDCHSRLRGVYSGTNTLLLQLVPIVYEKDPELVHTHATEILYVAPELNGLIATDVFRPIPVEVYQEHQRFLVRAYSTVRPLLLAHGLTNFLKKCAALPSLGHLNCYFENVHAADELDRQFLAILVRRVDPAGLTVGVGATDEPLPEVLETALDRYARPVSAAPLKGQDTGHELERAPTARRAAWARAFVDSDGTSDVPLELAAYEAAEAAERQQWHDQRAELLERQNDFGLRLGAIPYHRAHGRFPATLGAAAYMAATEYVTDVGYYEAAVRIGDLGRALVDRATQMRDYRSLFLDQDIPLLALRRTDEARRVYRELRSFSSEPGVQAHAAYGMAMLYVRYYPAEQRDYTEARAWINNALALARTLPEVSLRAHLTAFEQNGLALVEYRLGHFDEAIRLETEAMELLDSQPGPHWYELFLRRALLSFNRAQVYTTVGRHDDAVADLTSVIDLFPEESDGYLERGNAHRCAGRAAEALADYDRAIARNPPPEAYYNRAGLLSELGREQEALADYDTVLDLDPDHVDTLVNRAGIHYDRGDHGTARRDVEYGLALAPGNAQLLCTLGLLDMADDRKEAAAHALTRAIEHDPTLAAAWVNRAVLAFGNGDAEAAIDDLTEALALGEDPTIRYNRAVAHEHRQHWQQAIDDFTGALLLDRSNAEEILVSRAACHRALGRLDDAQRDLDDAHSPAH
ncbi:tetratricopeptide repeat protein [Streptomyces sp. NPDC086182]|jgi:tetratricopeptide (TPR) repeat protein|uniref:tetratricopeptide repeat protein n=1 Tax=Streptomyces sp. NPDC086182 TaxID=3155058 RepID=UPI00344152F7